MTTNQKVAGSSPAERAIEIPAFAGKERLIASLLRRPARSVPQLVPQRGSGGFREHPAEAAHGFALHVGHHVRVGIQCNRDPRVAEDPKRTRRVRIYPESVEPPREGESA